MYNKIKRFRIVTLRLSKPYPIIKLVVDGSDLVFSLCSHYIRIGWGQ